MDAQRVASRTGWAIHHHPVLASTNDEAARLRAAGAGERVAVVADRQTAGRGRGGHRFASPPGGLYVSLLVVARADDLPGPLTAALGVAAAEAVEAVTAVPCGIKWPNDLMVGGRKVGGILLEAAGAGVPVIAGLGLNVATVPAELPEDVAASTVSLSEAAGGLPSREALLVALLARVDARLAELSREDGRAVVERAWRGRLVLIGARIRYRLGPGLRRGRLLDASLEQGVLVHDDRDGEVWRRPEHVRELRADR